MNTYIVITDNHSAFLVKDLSGEKAMSRILHKTTVLESIKVMSVDTAFRFTRDNILQFHNDEVTHLVL